MFDKEKLEGADIGIDFCGYHLQSHTYYPPGH